MRMPPPAVSRPRRSVPNPHRAVAVSEHSGLTFCCAAAQEATIREPFDRMSFDIRSVFGAGVISAGTFCAALASPPRLRGRPITV